LLPQHVEGYLALVSGLLVVVMGVWILLTARSLRSADGTTPNHEPAPDHQEHDHAHGYRPDHVPGSGTVPHSHPHREERGTHTHGWGIHHTHRLDAVTSERPKLLILLGLGIAGGILPDPAALAILLSALTHGQIMLSLGTMLVFSLGFASTLVIVGVVAAQMGHVVLTWLSGPWVARLQIGTALLLIGVGVVLTASAWRLVCALP